jgi:RNA polymerase-binding transcription factor DksA
MAVTGGQRAVRAWPGSRVPVRGVRWRRLLEDRWRDRLSQVTAAALAFHDAAAVAGGDPGRHGALHELLTRASAARRALADVDDALARLAGGNYGLCESCGGAIPAGRLAAVPEARYCPQCETPALPAARGRRPLTVR